MVAWTQPFPTALAAATAGNRYPATIDVEDRP